jgi:hypothetical protein
MQQLDNHPADRKKEYLGDHELDNDERDRNLPEFEEVLDMLAYAKIPLPPGTTPENFMDRLRTALHVNQHFNAGKRGAEPIDVSRNDPFTIGRFSLSDSMTPDELAEKRADTQLGKKERKAVERRPIRIFKS